MHLTATLLSFALFSTSLSQSSHRSPTLGVPKEKLSSYVPIAGSNPPQWRCLDGTGDLLPFSAVNDDYCDCEDGSDEPGTSACKGGSFHCVNEGHLPKDIPNIRVNDGLCDSDCCDGSDEAPGVCPNRCAELGEAYRKTLEQERKLRRTGSKIRSTYVAYAKKEKTRLEQDLIKGREAVDKAILEEKRLKALLDRAESTSAEALEYKLQSPLYDSLLAHSSAVKTLVNKVADLETKIVTLKSILEDLEKGHNPNYQDMAVRGAIKGYQAFLEKEKITASETEEESPEEAVKEEDMDKWTAEELKRLGQSDLTELLLEHEHHLAGFGKSDDSILFSIEHYLPEAWLPYYHETKNIVVSWMVRLGVVKGVLDSSDSDEVKHARAAHANAQSVTREAEKRLQDDEDLLYDLGGFYGPDGEWLKLKDTCIEKNTGEYTYSGCFFGQATQKGNNGGGVHNLGRFSDWNADAKEGTMEYYSSQMYEHGARCWNGPERSVKLVLTCGTENALLSVAEPEKCEYMFEATTPALCWPLETEAQTKDEL
ncbi:hypothetical protein DACRYDRAFT_25080 [Dacryopinax primogenitus]|uniref:Glucosidase 2 subunit beta n=1 Tax=Dacryopinax primogenitus (strain DJM 731) TaxID=1858805 RepID=M5FQI5_DACPD|nr:uncharacterized protein DACRYDRAFT_25080 [Dacryopinax primogenitus]EJT97743.1 hypothetical protein DACRYDRAFT_25080 [Dacryopinax primogenitus]